jgi:predicted phosphodiesterase
MKLHILSDIHNEFSVLEPPETDADVLILAGDIDVHHKSISWAQSFNKPVIYVLGNPEFYGYSIEEVRAKTRELTQNKNIHFLDDDELLLTRSAVPRRNTFERLHGSCLLF